MDVIPVVGNASLTSSFATCFKLAIKFLFERRTPLGKPVVPLEYGIKIRSSKPLCGASLISHDSLANSEKFIAPSGNECPS